MPPTLEVLRLNGDAGKAPILFLHGAWMGAWCWAEWMNFFNARGHTTIAPSYRAHGGSSGRERLRWTRLSEYVEDARSVLHSLEVPPVVIAHSLGGAVAARMLEACEAQALVLIAGLPAAGALGSALRLARHHPLQFLIGNLTLSLHAVVGTPALVRALLYAPTTPEVTVQDTLRRVQDESYRAFLDALLFRPQPLPSRLPRLVLTGDCDGLFTLNEAQATARFYNTDLKRYLGMGHNLMLEEDNLIIAQDIASWLEGLGI
jgi:pimeloyl-ACP methyl ester carboxylesterase